MKKYFYNDREITEEEAKRIEAQNSQEEYIPTKNEIFNHLRCSGCTWCGGRGCECYSRTLKECFEGAKNDLIHSHKMKNKVFVVDDENKNDAQSIFDEWYKELFEG